MSVTPETAALERWLRVNGGHLHSGVHVAYDDQAGVHWRADSAIEGSTVIATVPHCLAFSYLNALVDDAYPVFKQHKRRFKIEAIGFFYLMAQYLDREKSFWKPYLDTLPRPEDVHTTPLWFDEPEDLAWLDATDVLHTGNERREIYQQYYCDGIAVLSKAGLDTTAYTWDLFRWAITIFTSRAFSSRSITPQESKYWTTYKSRPHGRRQTVLLDMSHTPAGDLDFSVLFPVIDAANHRHEAKVEWTFDPARFNFRSVDSIEPGAEVFNNYGPKANAELFLGYGFCIPENPYDTVLLTLKQPPHSLQQELKQVYPGYFVHDDGAWSSEKTTFGITQMDSLAEFDVNGVFGQLPEPLLELLTYQLRHERGLPFHFEERPLEFLTEGNGRRHLPYLARMLVQSLAPKLQKLQVPLAEPRHAKQLQASIYRDGQISILESVTTKLRQYLRSLRPPSAPGTLLSLEEAIEAFGSENAMSCKLFLAGIEASANTRDIEQLRLAGWEEDVWVLFICWLYLSHADIRGIASAWLTELVAEYAVGMERGMEKDGARVESQASSLMEAVVTARDWVRDSAWARDGWSEGLLAKFGGRVLGGQGMMMTVPDEVGVEEPRLVVHLHAG